MKSTKKPLLHSLLALLLCVSMLVSSTFAWFTDRVSTKNNIITSGNLDLEMYWTDDLSSGTWYNVEDEQYNTIFSYENWEPGYTEVKYIKLVNAGELALNYDLAIEAQTGVGKLAEVISVYYGEGAIPMTQRTDLDQLGCVGFLNNVMNGGATASGTLLPADEQSPFHPSGEVVMTIAMSMITTAGNEYQNETSGDFTVRALATQASYESDSFGSDYDASAELPTVLRPGSASAEVTPVDGKVPTGGVNMEGNGLTAFVQEGTALVDGADKLTLTVTPMEDTTSGIVAVNDEILIPVDVHVEGIAEGNTVPVVIDLGAVLPKYLNMGNYRLIHVEDGVNQEMTRVSAKADLVAHNQFTYDPATGAVTVAMATFSEIAMLSETLPVWEGEFDYTWYKADAQELTIVNGDQLAAFGAIVGGMKKVTGRTDEGTYTYSEEIIQDNFDGKTVKLVSDINLADEEGNSDGKIFYPIGYYNSDKTYEKTGTAITSGLKNFEGTFDGNGNTISNFYQNTWEMKGDHDWYAATDQYYRDGMGLFGRVYGGTVKNLTVSNFSCDSEIGTTGVIAAYADSTNEKPALFENIAIKNCNPRVYNIGNGGIVGCAGWYSRNESLYNTDYTNAVTFRNITADQTNKISALWGSWGVSCAGILGQYYPDSSCGIKMENCHVAAIIDVNNDVCSNYQYYWYRYAGMFIGTIRANTTEGGYTVADTTGVSATGCTYTMGTWNEYWYCEIVANSLASYTHDHQFSRLTNIYDLSEIKSGDTWLKEGHFALLSADRTSVECYHIFKDSNGNLYQHFHDKGDETNGYEPYETVDVDGDGTKETVLKEDRQRYFIPFNQLFTGLDMGIKAHTEFKGITFVENGTVASKEKFSAESVTDIEENATVTLDKLFASKVDASMISMPTVQVYVSPVGYGSTVSATYSQNVNDWTQSTLTFSGTGSAKVVITDYFYCTSTTMYVTVGGVVTTFDKFETKFNNPSFLYRVGSNAAGNTVALGTMFKEKDDVTVDDAAVAVTITSTAGNASGVYTPNETEWEKGTIKFEGTGVVKVAISAPGTADLILNLEVVDAVNVTSATNATSNNVVLLQNCGFSSLDVSGGYTLYGNGFTLTCASDSYAADFGYAFVTLSDGTLDNVQIVCPNFDYAALYKSNLTSGDNRSYTDANGKTRYYNAKSGVMVSGNSQILNSRISGARAAVNVTGGNVLIDNSRIELGAVASILVGSANSLTLRDVTLVQKPAASTYDSSKELMGFSVLVICDSEGNSTPITLEGKLTQDAWVSEDDKQYVPSAGQTVVTNALKQTDYLHDLDKDGTRESLCLGIAYMPESTTSSVKTTNITDNRTNESDIPYEYAEVSIMSGKTYVYSWKYAENELIEDAPTYVPDTQGDIITVTYSDTSVGLETGKSYDADGWVYELNVDLDKAIGYELDFSKLSMVVNNVAVTDYKVNGSAKPTSPIAVTAGGVTYTLTATIDGKEYAATFKVTGTETTKESPTLVASNYEAALLVGEAGNTLTKDTWHGAAPVLKGVQIKYWSVAEKQYKTITLSDYTPTTSGKQNGTEAVWTYTPANGDFTLTIKNETAVHSNNGVYAMPVVVNGTLYFVANGSKGLVNYGNSARTVKINYYFKDNNGGEELKFDHTWSIECANGNTAYDYSDFCSGTSKTFTIKSSNGNVCVTGDTLVTLADGTQKRIDQVTYSDQLLVWNFFTGKYDSVPSAIIFNHGKDNYDVLKLVFSDGTSVKVLNNHGFFDEAENAFVFIDEENVAEYVGHRFVKVKGNTTSTVTLVAYEIYREYVGSYSIQSAVHNNFMVEGMFSITMPHYDGWFDYFEIGEGMKYDEKKMQADIAKYGLYTYEDFSKYVTYEQFIAFNGPYLKVLVGRGVVTYVQIIELIAMYVN